MKPSRNEQQTATAELAITRDIFVRAHTVVPQKSQRQRPSLAKWPDEVIVIDMETTLDTAQTLNSGAYRRCKLRGDYQCVEEGLVYADDLDNTFIEVLRDYVHDPSNFPDVAARTYPPQTRLTLQSRTEFVERVFWKSIRKGAMVVGFNLPFDLARLAVKATSANKGGWSLVLSTRKSRKTGELMPNPDRPRIVIRPIDSKAAFISLGSILHPEEWPGEGRFLDLHTLGRALRDQSHSLKSACEQFGAPCKMDHTPTGRVTFEEIDYCRQDVRATAGLLNAMRREFNQHPIDLRPDRAYSPASLAKAYLDTMNIARPKEKFSGLQ